MTTVHETEVETTDNLQDQIDGSMNDDAHNEMRAASTDGNDDIADDEEDVEDEDADEEDLEDDEDEEDVGDEDEDEDDVEEEEDEADEA